MGTNVPAKRPDIRRITVPAATEVSFHFEGVVSVIGFHIQTIGQSNLYIGLSEGATFSTDNFYTLKASYVMIHRDINWTPTDEALWLRSSSGEITCEIMYWG